MYKFLYLIIMATSYGQAVSDQTYMGAEATALAGAIVSQQGSSESIFHNPAGLAGLDAIQFSAGGGNLYGFNWLPAYHLSGVLPLPGMGTMGIAVQQFETKHGDKVLSSEQTFSIAQGFNLQQDKNSHLAMGFTANFIQWNLGKSAGVSGDGSDGFELGSLNSFTIDLGIRASLREKYQFGAFIKNINSGAIGKGMSRQVLPKRINVGITYEPIPNLTTSIVAERLLGREDLQIKGAMRYRLNPFLDLYSGAQSNPSRLGFGFKLSIGELDGLTFTYGLLTHPVLPLMQQVSIGFKL